MSGLQPLRVSLVQGDTRWHDAPANRDHYRGLIEPLAGRSDLIVLPETFLSGFTNAIETQAEDMAGEGLAWLRDMAARTGAVVTGSLVIGEAGRVVNRLVWMQPEGQFHTYDKRHLFRMAGEHERYAPGRDPLIRELKGWRVRAEICYDLRFPVWLRNRWDAGAGRPEYDLILFVANWPAVRRHAWRSLLRARAIENLACCIGVNRVGTDGNGLAYSGDSVVLDALGQPLVELGGAEQVATLTLDPEPMLQHRERFPAWRDADAFTLGEAGQG